MPWYRLSRAEEWLGLCEVCGLLSRPANPEEPGHCVASVMIPLAKLIALAYLLINVQRGSIRNNRERTRLYRLVEFVGRWSMLDVYVDTFAGAAAFPIFCEIINIQGSISSVVKKT
jgi:hypothetical protein